MKKNFSALGQIWFILKFIAKFLWDTDKKTLISVILLNTSLSLFIIPNLLLDKAFLDTLVDNIKKPNPQEVFQTILIIVFARFVFQALRTLVRRLSGYYTRILFWKQNQKAESTIGMKYATIAVPTLEDPAFKDRYNRIERESLNRLQRITENFVNLPQHMSGIISSLSLFVFTQPLVVIFSLVSLLPTIVVERIYIKKDYELDKRVSVLHRFRGMYYYFLGRSKSYLELRLLNIHAELAKKIYDYWQKIIEQRTTLIKSKRTWGFLAGLFDNAISYSFDGLFGFQVIIGKITIGTAQAYIRAISSFKENVTNLTASVLELYENYLYLTDLVWFLNLESPYFNSEGIKLGHKLTKGIKFDNVWFKYPETENWILKGVSFEISPQQNIAIVGKNGAGKTTIVKLLCGFYTPSKGAIYIDGHDVASLNKAEYWRRLSALFQDSDAFGITIREIITASKIKDATDIEKIKRFTQATRIDGWIESLPLKYENPIGRDFEHGVSPSSGQWQRIAITRTLFKDPEIMILDEPTSNVDPEAEEQIFNEILDIGEKKIIIFISHRFSTVRRADKIVVLEEGSVIESGSHSQLLKKKGIYARLFRLQAKSYQ